MCGFHTTQSSSGSYRDLCSGFLWSGSPNDYHKAKVSWNYLCLPKSEGGLGIHKLRETSKVFALGLVWRLFSMSGSLWVAWAHTELMKSGSFWDVKESTKGTWLCRKLIKLRPLASSFLRKDVRNGE